MIHTFNPEGARLQAFDTEIENCPKRDPQGPKITAAQLNEEDPITLTALKTYDIMARKEEPLIDVVHYIKAGGSYLKEKFLPR